ncbi:pyrroline-5-carboxylate reductase [Amaricoccus tamworthensis]|uniref:pyrroline-5-carboxylate reductase n=1 Tax=Amaricoccus tamworthensis TaxID=57002 RepID=UPI003C7AA50D
MDFSEISDRGLVLVGCGKMGTALLDGWLRQGLEPNCFTVIDPKPSDHLKNLAKDGLRLNAEMPPNPAIAVLAVKPQMMGEVLPQLSALCGGQTVFLSIAAGTPISRFEESLGGNSPIIRAMPNTPSAIGEGITALVGNAQVDPGDLELADKLMQAVGKTVRLENENQMDAVTGVSGSGPAYVFLMMEAMTRAGVAQGLPEDLALELVRTTVAGAGALANSGDTKPEQLRINVTSPKGTTEAALKVLMREGNGLTELMEEAVAAAADRGRELAK